MIRLNHGCSVFAGPGTVVADNRLVDNGQMGVKAAGRRVQIVRNEVSRNNFAGHDTYYEAGGAKFWNAVDLVLRLQRGARQLGFGRVARLRPHRHRSSTTTPSRDNTEGGVSAEMTISGPSRSTRSPATTPPTSATRADARRHLPVQRLELRRVGQPARRQQRRRGGPGAAARLHRRQHPAGPGRRARPAPGSARSRAPGCTTTVIDDRQGFSGLLVLANSDLPPYAAGAGVSGRIAAVQGHLVRLQRVRRFRASSAPRGTNGNLFDERPTGSCGASPAASAPTRRHLGVDRPAVRGFRRLAGVRRSGRPRRAAQLLTISRHAVWRSTGPRGTATSRGSITWQSRVLHFPVPCAPSGAPRRGWSGTNVNMTRRHDEHTGEAPARAVGPSPAVRPS